MPKREKHNYFGVLLLLCCLCFSCAPHADYRNYVSFKDGWPKDAAAEFKLPPLNGRFNLFIHLRNDNSYSFSNIFVIAELKQDNVILATDTLEYNMASPQGEWLGTGISEVKESKLYWKEKIQLQDNAFYSVRLRHALREMGQPQGVEDLMGILAVGLAAEKTP